MQIIEIIKTNWAADDRGFGAYDIFNAAGLPGQFNVSELAPGAVRGFHFHNNQTDYVFCPKGDMHVILVPNFKALHPKPQHYFIGEHNPCTLIIPPGVLHGYKALYNKPATMVYYVDKPYNPDDEGRMPWDMLGKGIWEIKHA